MITFRSISFHLMVLGFMAVSGLYAQQGKRVLFLGNSQTYVNDMPNMVYEMAASTGDVLIYDESTHGGYSYQDHLNNSESISKIQQGGWDFVVLQGRSGWPSLWDDFVETNVMPYAERLNDSIKKYNPCAQTVFFHTWGYQNGYQFYCPTWPAVCDYEGMDDMLQARYPVMALEFEAIIAPVGPVWRYLREDSPIIINLHDPDGTHAAVTGTYAGAMAFYTTLFRKDPNLVSYNPGIFNQEVDLIKAAVTNVVYNDLDQWFIRDYDPYAEFNIEQQSGLSYNFINTSPYADSYSWDFGDGNTSDEENPSHTYAENGVFNVELTIGYCGNFYQTTTVLDTSILGLENPEKADFKVYPNPASAELNLQLGSRFIDSEIRIYTISGQLVEEVQPYREENITLDISELPDGLYFLKLESLSIPVSEVFKILIQN